MVKTSPSQGGVRGSIPLGAAKVMPFGVTFLFYINFIIHKSILQPFFINKKVYINIKGIKLSTLWIILCLLCLLFSLYIIIIYDKLVL